MASMNSDAAKKKLLRRGQRIALISSLITFAVALIKGLVGYGFESRLLLADALHSAGDVVTIAASGFGLWLAARSKSTKFPYGLYRAETVASLFIGVFILFAGVEMIQNGYAKLFSLETVAAFPVLPVGAALLSIVANSYMAGRQAAAGRAINSPSLLVKARDTQLDIYISVAVLGGILLAYWQVPYVEGILILIIALLILKLGGETVWLSVMSLLDANLDPDLQAEIGAMCSAIGGVRAVTGIRIRRAGPFRLVDCTFEASPQLSLYKAHELANQVEEAIIRQHRDVDTVFVHVEPYRGSSLAALVPVTAVNGLDSPIHDHFGRAPYFALIRFDEEQITVEDFYFNEFLHEKLHIGVKIIKAIAASGIDILFTRHIGELAFSLLKERFVDIYQVEENLTIRQLVVAYRQERLPRLHAPTHGLDDSETGRKSEPLSEVEPGVAIIPSKGD
jgi:cation diffusion facilitator family transporter